MDCENILYNHGSNFYVFFLILSTKQCIVPEISQYIFEINVEINGHFKI